jgi:hypothetical protein
MVQHAGFPKDRGKSGGAFKQAADGKFRLMSRVSLVTGD